MPKVTEEHRAARRLQIRDAALRCVTRQGFHKTTMADVIAESGLSAGAVYGYFASKQELIRALAEAPFETLAAVLDELDERDPVTPEVALQLVLERLTENRDSSRIDFPKLAVQAWAEAARDDEVRTMLADRVRLLRASWRHILERAQGAGLVEPDADLDDMSRAIAGMIPGFLVQSLVIGDVDPVGYTDGLRGLIRRRD